MSLTPVRDVTIAARLVRGGGSRDAVRLALMAAGIAAAVLALLFATTIPRAVNAAAQRSADRLPDTEATDGPAIHAGVERRDIGDRPWHVVHLTAVEPGAALPPGLTRWPRPGEAIVSPALAELLAGNAQARARVGTVAGLIADDGLTSPDELASYSRSDTRAASASGPGFTAWGVPVAETDIATGMAMIPAEVALLVVLPALVFLAASARLSVTTRRRRLVALRLLGVTAERCSRIFAGELALVAVVATVLALVGYAALMPVVAGSGLVGMRWFAADTTIGLAGAALIGATAFATSWLVGSRSIQRTLRAPRGQGGDDTGGTWRGWLGSVIALPSIAALGVVAWSVRTSTGSRFADTITGIWFWGTIAAVVGTAIAFPSVVAAIAMWLSRRGGLPIWLRLGARQAAARRGTGALLLVAAMALIVLASVATAFVRGSYLDAVGDLGRATVGVAVDEVPRSARPELARVPADAMVTVVPAVAGDDSISVAVAGCAAYLWASGLDTRGATCPDADAMRLATADGHGAPPPGTRFTVTTTTGVHAISVPTASLDVMGPDEVLIAPATAPWIWDAPRAYVTYTASALDGSVLRTQAAVEQLAPDASVHAGVRDPLALLRYRQQSAVLRVLVGAGFLLCVLGFLTTALDARWAGEPRPRSW